MKKNLKLSVKGVAALIASTLLLGGAIGGTMAWLTDRTEAVTNTFTIGDINIELWEHDYIPETNALNTADDTVTENADYKIVPGVNLPKDPTVTVKESSEPCWLFVTVAESTNWPKATTSTDSTVRKIDYSIADGWTELEDGVYYKKLDATTEDTDHVILSGNQITVSDELTKTEANGITGNLTLTFKAYAIQQAGFESAKLAWAEVSK